MALRNNTTDSNVPSGNTHDFSELRPTLRDDLSFTLQQYGGTECYVLEDAVRGKYYRIGLGEYTFMSMLDGGTSMHEALALTASRLGQGAFSSQDAAGICKWLFDNELVETSRSQDVHRLRTMAEKQRGLERKQKLNPILMRMPLGSPNKILDALAPLLGWIVSAPGMLLWAIVMLVAGQSLFVNWDRLASHSQSVFAPGNWIWLGVAWIALKVLHECCHAFACRRFGGNVRETGLLFILLAPIPYVDVSSSWRFASKWQRIFVAAAGMYVELMVAAVAAIVWCHTDSEMIRQHAYNVMLLAGITTILFNANPLMRFDGYYILADLLEIPNLYSRGQQYVLYVCRRYLLGLSSNLQSTTIARDGLVRIYGCLSLIWRILICVGLVIAAEALFYGAGVALALGAVGLWLALPLAKFVKFMCVGNQREVPDRSRFAVMAGGLSLGLCAVLLFVPWPTGITAPAVVAFSDAAVVRNDSAGFVTEVLVQAGDNIKTGQTIAILENPELTAELEELKLSVKQAVLRARQHQLDGNVAGFQAEQKAAEAYRNRIVQRQSQIEQLAIKAPCNGQIVSEVPSTLLGSYLQVGSEIVTIADERNKELNLLVSQHDRERFTAQVGGDVCVKVSREPRASLECKFQTLDPQATTQIESYALGAPFGGPLPIVLENGSDASETKQWKLLTPRFRGLVPLDANQSKQLRAGETALVRLQDESISVGEFLYIRSRDWIRAQRDLARWQS